MKDFSTFFQICIYMSVTMVIFCLCLSFISGLGIFQTTFNEGIVSGDTSNETFAKYTQDNMNMSDIWLLVFTGAGAAGLLIAWFTHSTNIIGVFLFSVVFWAAYGNALVVINVNNFLMDILGFVAIATVGMTFIFVGAIAGMLSGSG